LKQFPPLSSEHVVYGCVADIMTLLLQLEMQRRCMKQNLVKALKVWNTKQAIIQQKCGKKMERKRLIRRNSEQYDV